jgi:hypothetical protein
LCPATCACVDLSAVCLLAWLLLTLHMLLTLQGSEARAQVLSSQDTGMHTVNMLSSLPSPLKRPKLMAVPPLQPPPVVPAGPTLQPVTSMPPPSSAATPVAVAPPAPP